MERKWLTGERANAYGRKKITMRLHKENPKPDYKEISRKKSAEGRFGSPLPIRQRGGPQWN